MSSRILTGLIFLMFAGFAGCGDSSAPPPPPSPTASAPAVVEGTVVDEKGRAAYKTVVRAYRKFDPGTVVAGTEGSGAMAEMPSGKGTVAGPDMKLLASAECDGKGKFKLQALPAGPVLIATGDTRMGMWQQWITLEGGSTQKLEIRLPGRK